MSAPADALARVRALLANDATAGERLALELVQSHPHDAEAWRAASAAAVATAQPRAALERIVRALKLAADNARAWQDLGELYLGFGQPVEAEQAFQRAVHVAPDDPSAWLRIGYAQEAAGERSKAVVSYRKAVELEGYAGTAALALASLSIVAGELVEAEDVARRALAARGAEDADAAFVLGNVLASTNRNAEAAAVFERAENATPQQARLHHNLGLAREMAGDRPGAKRAFEAALRVDPTSYASLAQLVHLKRLDCDWAGLDSLNRQLRDAVRVGAPGVTPFSFLSEPATPAEQRRCAEIHAAGIVAAVAPLQRQFATAAPRRATAATNVRAGFVSSGFNSHPTALLTVELIERLRNEGVTTHGFATTPDDGTPLRARIARAFDRFVDVAALDAAAIAARIRDANVDVLFDLRGYGGGSVSEVFALRPAPVQVNWLAYPATSGAPFIDYLVADRVVVPDEQREHYSEALAYLPHCFQPSDTTRAVPPPPPRVACGLPEAGPVLASFNNAYKIAPDTFACWMRVMAAVPDACLWLLGDAKSTMATNLRDAAQRAGVDAARLHFMAKLPHSEYLARYALVDLFLDTWPYNAHTTASDALWAGCPVLTLPGATFAARVAASLLRTLGLAELIARDEAEYIAIATRLARDADARSALRARVAAARAASPLFDMKRFAADFARIVRAMAARSARGLAPADMT